MSNWIKSLWNGITSLFVKDYRYDGCIKDKPDDRDHIKSTKGLVLAKSIDGFSLSEYCPEVVDQGSTGSCTGFASAYAVGILLNKMQKLSETDITVPRMSPYWNYYWARKLDATDRLGNLFDEKFYTKDQGATIRSVMQAIKDYGSISHHLNFNLCKSKLPSELKDAHKTSYKIKEYLRIPNYGLTDVISDTLKVLSIEKLPIVACILFYNEQMEKARTTGILDKIVGDKTYYGAHAICLTGYKYIKGKLYIEFINSYGKSWGDEGYGYFDADMLDTSEYIADLWTFDKGYF